MIFLTKLFLIILFVMKFNFIIAGFGSGNLSVNGYVGKFELNF